MTDDPVRRYLRCKEQAEAARRDADRAAGAVDQLLADLRQHGVETAADVELERLQRLEAKQTAALTAAVAQYEEEFERG